MDSTRSTIEQIPKAELMQAYEAYASGTDVGWLAARYGVYPVELQEAFAEISARLEEESRARKQARNGEVSIFGVQCALRAELASLQDIDVRDTELLKAEIARSAAVESIAQAFFDGLNTAIEAKRLEAAISKKAVTMPKLLEV